MTDADVDRVVDAVLDRVLTELQLDDPQPVRDLLGAYLDGETDMNGLDLYYELERAAALLTFHTMLRGGPRNQARSGLQQSYGDHNRLLMHGLDQLVAGDLDWYRERLDPDDPVPDALPRCFEPSRASDSSATCWSRSGSRPHCTTAGCSPGAARTSTSRTASC